jgi:hypothetical protein
MFATLDGVNPPVAAWSACTAHFRRCVSPGRLWDPKWDQGVQVCAVVLWCAERDFQRERLVSGGLLA